MSKKEKDNKLLDNQEFEDRLTEVQEFDSESDNQSKMINASRAFRNLPLEFIMGGNDPRSKN
ncbi:hypothetical protein [Desulfoscipio gibsoniae]|uniref:Uncharacterized protein n=1 Tax=Desulfoscipio gibsoniae DSM 7213 TaxID=767817 RepID=R4KTW8_9FIRM|nr:hypothetical protein [Desulfoscipio gibsoniae]AGL03041.1 hypothetical protein Desgi_3719 [Desulfoscipio gibsoniae DSM 7213]